MTPEERFERIEKIIEEQQRTIDKHNEAIKDLIRVGRIITDAQQVTNTQITRLAEDLHGVHGAITRVTEDIAQLREA